MSLYAKSTLFVMLGLLASCASPPPQQGKPLPAGYLYKGSFLNIHSPRQKGWYLSSASHAGMQFTRHGDKKGERFTAQVQTFPLPRFKHTRDMVSFLKNGFEKDTRSARFTIIKSDFKLSDVRKYPCVSVSAVIQDNQATGSHAHHKKLILQSYSLYCRHPVQKLAGFAITYSHRGKSLYPGLKQQARAFMAGVQVPR
ncbi:MAG: hypothetical protein P8Z75_01865 [Gammaproteobacteria bacterium]|jgi:hypothetical protein